MLAAAASLKRKRREEEFFMRYDVENLPSLLVEALRRNVDEDAYVEATRNYSRAAEEEEAAAATYIPAIPPGVLVIMTYMS